MPLILYEVLVGILFILVLYLSYKYRQIVKKVGNLGQLNEKISSQAEELLKQRGYLNSVNVEILEAQGLKITLEHDIELAQEKAENAKQLAEKDLIIEKEKRLADFTSQLEEEYQKLLATSPKRKYEEELAEIQAEILKSKQRLEVQQEQYTKSIAEEDFINYHSIDLSDADKQDIMCIREFASRLNRKEALAKLIWTEFYQKPLQSLCKTLQADKVMGIYKITEIETGRMYIGQAVDIGARWKEHAKTGLGVGSITYQFNKFYKALYTKGIENFTFEILEVCEKDDLGDKEFYWIDFYNATTFGFNTKIGG